MKVYTLILVYYDYHKFEDVEDVGADLDGLIRDRSHDLQVFSDVEQSSDDFECPNDQDGYCYYYWKEWVI